jgi:serralysin
VTDGSGNAASANATVTVEIGVNDPFFTSSVATIFEENEVSVVLDVNANSGSCFAADEGINYTISGGADQGLFEINNSNGFLTFLNAPDFENPMDANGDNDYEVEVTADNGSTSTPQLITVTVDDLNDNAPEIDSPASFSVDENNTFIAEINVSDADISSVLTFSVSGGTDAGSFAVNMSTGALSFQNPPDFESPVDGNADNVYEVEVTVTDGDFSDSQLFNVNVSPVDESFPLFINLPATVEVNEGTTFVVMANAEDQDEGETISYRISGGADGSFFTIDGFGTLEFIDPPDFENPQDANSDNVYEVEIEASGDVNAEDEPISVTVLDLLENTNPIINDQEFSLAENSAVGTTVGTVIASDPDGDDLEFGFVPGAAANSYFAINRVIRKIVRILNNLG